MEELDGQLKEGLAKCFELSSENLVSKQCVLEALSIRIGQLITGNPEQLFSLLYRLDISEQKIKKVLNEGNEIPFQLANLVYERQLEKVAWRKHFKDQQQPDDELSW